MPAQRISMRKFKEVLRLTFSLGLTHRQVARSLRLSKTTVSKYLDLAASAHLSWPLPVGISDAELTRLLFPKAETGSLQHFTIPDFPSIHQELKRKGVTLLLLWEEYSFAFPGSAYQYSQFCHLYNQWRSRLKIVLRQTHRAGEKLFVDYAGQTVPICDPSSGQIHQAQIFVAVLGASNYTYAEATFTQTLADWTASHVRAFNFFGGVPELIVPDNLKSGVSKACRYEPDLNPTYDDLAAHYGIAVMPARPYKPRDKAKAEVGVQIVERWILARLRRMTFFSIEELNLHIRALMDDLNLRPFKKLLGSRLSLFETLDKPALKPLPATAFEFCIWKKARAGYDYHIEVEGHFYSVPHSLVRQVLDIRVTASIVECFHQGRRVASHPRSLIRGGQTTLPDHMPMAHRKHLEWTSESLLEWAEEIGPNTHCLVNHLIGGKSHPEQGYRSCLGLMALSRRYGTDRLERACERALAIGSPRRASIDSILKQGLDLIAEAEEEINQPILEHENVRGAAYYADNTTTE